MKVLIAGATGLVGRDLVGLCQEKNIEIYFLTTRSEKLDSIPGAKGFLWNPAKGEIDLKCFNDVNAIINLAGAPIAQRWTRSNREAILNSRVNSVKTLYQGLKKSGSTSVKTVISASAIGIYPNSLTTFYTEDHLENAEGFAGSVVEAWEKEATKFEELVPHLAIVRIGLVLSRNGGALTKMAKPVELFAGAAFGSGEQWQSWVHIRDLSSLLIFICENDLSGKFNAVAPNPVTQNKLIKELAKVLNRPLILPNLPAGIIRLFLGEMAEILTSSQRVSSKKVESYGFDFKYQNICRALESIY